MTATNLETGQRKTATSNAAGNFEIFAARDDMATLAQLVDFTIARDGEEGEIKRLAAALGFHQVAGEQPQIDHVPDHAVDAALDEQVQVVCFLGGILVGVAQNGPVIVLGRRVFHAARHRCKKGIRDVGDNER